MPVILATWEAEIGKIMGWRLARANSSADSIFQNNQSKMDWRYDSNVRLPALQV
jgi:hypothetical protein